MSATLFRAEALAQQSERLHGTVLLVPRISHAVITIGVVLWLIATLTWLSTASYARKASVDGWLEPASGLIDIRAEGEEQIAKVFVIEGQAVTPGEPLVEIDSERVLADGSQLASLLLDELNTQRTLLDGKIERSAIAFDHRRLDITRRIAGARRALATLDEELLTLDQRIALVNRTVGRARTLERDGIASEAEFESLLDQQLQLRSDRQALLRNRMNQSEAIENLQTESQLLPQESAASTAEVDSQISDIESQIARLESERAYVIRAPRAGVVNNLRARAGQTTRAGTRLMTIVPPGATLTANLLVPVESIGFMQPDQAVDIRYDAFPFQTFGLYAGRITRVSDTVSMPDELNDAPMAVTAPVYRVTAELDSSTVRAYGRDFNLKSGMTLSANVQLSERSLVEWLLEPVLSLKGRL